MIQPKTDKQIKNFLSQPNQAWSVKTFRKFSCGYSNKMITKLTNKQKNKKTFISAKSSPIFMKLSENLPASIHRELK